MRGSSGSGSSSERRLEAEAAKRQTDEEAVERGAGRSTADVRGSPAHDGDAAWLRRRRALLAAQTC